VDEKKPTHVSYLIKNHQVKKKEESVRRKEEEKCQLVRIINQFCI
jgi:hypothetical protein